MLNFFSKIILLVVSVFLISSIGTAAQNNFEPESPVRVTERGATLEEAKQRAFRRAIEMRVGVLIVGERIVINQEFQENIFSYSSGFIKDYKHVSTERRDGVNFSTFDIWVKDSGIADGLLKYQPSSVSIEGRKLLDIVRSRDEQREDGENILARALAGWPHNATQASFAAYQTNYGVDRSVALNIQGIKIIWNPLFEKSLREVFDRISIKPLRNQVFYKLNWNQDYSGDEYTIRDGSIVNIRRDGGHRFSLFNNKYYAVGDDRQLNTITSAFSSNTYLLIELKDRKRNNLARYCVFLEGMTTEPYERPVGRDFDYWTEIPRVPRFISNLKVSLDRSYLEQFSDIELSVVSEKAC